MFCNLTAEAIFDSIRRMKEAIAACHIFVLCGGFSAGDEPDGSGKFIANVLNNKDISEEIHRLLDRGGLILGICNGFRRWSSRAVALWPAGYGDPGSPTLFRNDITVTCADRFDPRGDDQLPVAVGEFLGGRHPFDRGEPRRGKFVVSEPAGPRAVRERAGGVSVCRCRRPRDGRSPVSQIVLCDRGHREPRRADVSARWAIRSVTGRTSSRTSPERRCRTSSPMR